MTKSQIALNTINNIFQAAFGNTPVPDKSDPEKYHLKAASEDICYWGDQAIINTKNKGTSKEKKYIILQKSSPIHVKEMATGLADKTFLFFLIDDAEEYIFSIEIADLPKDNVPSQTISLFDIPTLANIKAQSSDILRVPITNTKNGIHYYDVVAIKIGPETNRDYKPLIHYIVSSDNRTYNKIIHNMVRFIETSEKKESISKDGKGQIYGYPSNSDIVKQVAYLKLLKSQYGDYNYNYYNSFLLPESTELPKPADLPESNVDNKNEKGEENSDKCFRTIGYAKPGDFNLELTEKGTDDSDMRVGLIIENPDKLYDKYLSNQEATTDDLSETESYKKLP